MGIGYGCVGGAARWNMRGKGAKYAVWLASGSFFKCEITSSFTFANFARFKQFRIPFILFADMSDGSMDFASHDDRTTAPVFYNELVSSDDQRIFNVSGECTNGAHYAQRSAESLPPVGALDRFPASLVADFQLFGRPCGGIASGTDSDEGYFRQSGDASPLPRGGKHPVYNPRKDYCLWCKCKGHSLLFCRKRLEHCERMREVNCMHGYHMPHLHDDLEIWRCQWCGTHLKSSYVKFNYPNTYAFEREKCEGNIERARRKYGN